MKLTYAFLFLLALGQSSFGASAADAAVDRTGVGASAAVTSVIDFEAQILHLAKGHYPHDFVSVETVADHGAFASASLGNSDHFFHGFLRVTLGNMEKELYVYLNSYNRLDIICEALPDSLYTQIKTYKNNRSVYLESVIKFTNLEGNLEYFKWLMQRDSDTRVLSHSVTNILPALDGSIKVLDISEWFSYDSNHLLITGLHSGKQVIYLSKPGEEPQKILEQNGDIDISIQMQSGNLYGGQIFPGNTLTINLFDCPTKSWKPTNITNQPTMLEGMHYGDFYVHPEKSDKIVCLRQPKDGLSNWDFFDVEYEELFAEKVALIRKDWAKKGYPFKDSPINFDSIGPFLYRHDFGFRRFARNFNFPFGPKGKIDINQEGVVETMIDQIPDLSAFKLKPYTLERHEVRTEDEYLLPYYTVDRMWKMDAGPRSILWWIQGGPHVEFSQDEDPIMDWFLDNNFLVVIPRERIRCGLGYDHYKAGKGKLDKQALLDAIAPINDLITKGVADPTRIFGHGFSYGGYAMASFATRWVEFAKGALFKPLGLIAEGAFLAPTVSSNPAIMELFVQKEVAPERAEAFLKSFFPLYKSNLEIPLFVIHGIYDHRCPIADARAFYEKFQANPLLRAYIEHPKAHGCVVDEGGEEDLGLRIVQTMASSLLPDINPATLRGRELADAGIDIKRGSELLGVIPSVPSYRLHLYSF
jgi:predicted esterase